MKTPNCDRRQFLRVSAGAAVGTWAGLAFPGRAIAQAIAGKPQLRSQDFEVFFDIARGTLTITRQGEPFLTNASFRLLGEQTFASTDSRYTRTATTMGRVLNVRCRDARGKAHLSVIVRLLKGAFTVQCFAENAGDTPLRITSLETARALMDDGAILFWPGASQVLTNGYMYYDPGNLEEFGWARARGTESKWNLGLYRDPGSEGLALGFLENRYADGRLYVKSDHTISLPGENGGVGLVPESSFNREQWLAPHASATGGRLLFQLGSDAFDALERYATLMGRVNGAKLNPPVNAWTHWAYTKQFVTEAEVLRNAQWAAEHLKPYGLEYIQIDDGYPRAYGDWESGANFPHGMKWIAEKIRALGFKAGIWICPYAIAEGTEVHREHPEWLVSDDSGLPRQVGGGPEHSQAFDSPLFLHKLYALDVTHPGAAEWLGNLFRRYAEDYGYDFFKIDFMEWTILRADKYFDSSFSKSAAYRKGVEVIRAAIGPNRHLLDCGPGPNSVGLIDSLRVGLDFAVLDEDQYFNHFNSNVGAVAKRYYFHGRAWQSDPDQLGLARLDLPQARAAASVIALSGGNLVSSDRLTEIDPARLEILRAVYPNTGRAARPLDLFVNEKPEIFSLPVSTPWGAWSVVGIFNLRADSVAQRRVTFVSLNLARDVDYLVFEFWTQKLLGEFRGSFPLNQDAQTVSLLAVHEKRGHPQFLSCTRHITQGEREIPECSWTGTALEGVVVGHAGLEYFAYFYYPDGYAWDVEHNQLFHDYEGYSVREAGNNVLVAHFHFSGEQIVFRVPFRQHELASPNPSV